MDYVGLKRISVALWAVISVLAITTSVHGAAVALLVQQTPDSAGSVSPPSGVHHFEADSSVVVTARPEPGFEFLYWLGDVGEPGALTTEVFLNKPKIIVAVFSPGIADTGATGAGSRANADGERQFLGTGGPVTAPRSAGDGGRTGFSPSAPQRSGPETPVPEPATLVLLSAGAMLLLGRRRTA